MRKMNKARKRLLACSVLSVFVLLTVLLGIINAVSFTMAARDADILTQRLSEHRGVFGPETEQKRAPGPMGPMGPDSPEMRSSVRYFTFAFRDGEERGEAIVFSLSAVTPEEAEAWAGSLRNESTGWTRGTYRYRVYTQGDRTFVTVIDQGRELLPAFRILIISACGELLCLLLSFLFLLHAGKRLFAPLEEADRKQREFISGLEAQFKRPLTVVSADTELLERADGPSDHTRSIRRQVEKMSGLLRDLESLSVLPEETEGTSEVPLSELLASALDCRRGEFDARGVELRQEIEEGVTLTADPDAVGRLIREITDNALQYSLHHAAFALRREGERILLLAENDTDLPEGACDQVFDRFTVLENAKNKENGAGLGLAYVKEIVKAHKGRASAEVAGGIFTLRITI